nr:MULTISPECIES: transposase zinc-binding domain-containing protein [Rhizobium/Agrobacterium group]
MAAGLEVADIFRRHGKGYRQAHDARLGRLERRAMSAIEMCRTARLCAFALRAILVCLREQILFRPRFASEPLSGHAETAFLKGGLRN